MLNQVVFVFAIAFFNQRASGYATNLRDYGNLGVIGGHTIPIQDAPYMAGLLYHRGKRDHLICGATIIHERFLLTTAGCTFQPGADKFASIGSTRYRNTSSNIKIKIEKIIRHERYNHFTFHNDISLLKLKDPVPFSDRISKITLPDKNFVLKVGTFLNVTGWGVTTSPDHLASNFLELSDPDFPLDLMRTVVPVTNHKRCNDEDDTVDATNICAGMIYHGACIGDCGDPVTYQGILAGIVSRLIPDRHESRDLCGTGFDIYTNVARFVDWINNTISKNLP